MTGPRFPLFCTRCGSTSHYAEDCTRMPAGIGMSQQERDFEAGMRRDRNAFIAGMTAMIIGLVLAGWMEIA